jgi:hypothetical protein
MNESRSQFLNLKRTRAVLKSVIATFKRGVATILLKAKTVFSNRKAELSIKKEKQGMPQ